MQYVKLEETAEGKLLITLTDRGREMLGSYLENPCEVFREIERGHDPKYQWSKPHATILSDLLEDQIANSDLEMLSDVDAADIGALTSSPLLAYGVQRAEKYKPANANESEVLEGQILKLDRVYWFPNYQVESELETLLRAGKVEFETGHKEPSETYTCEGCQQTFDNDTDALDHKCMGAK